MTARFIVSAVLLLLVAAALIFVLHQRFSDPAYYCKTVMPKPTIVAFGDSLVYGYGATPGNDFPTVLGSLAGVPVQNLGVSGETTGEALTRLKGLRLQPDIALILLGGNDALQQLPLAETKANLKKIIDTFRSEQTKPVQIILIGVMGGYPSDPYAAMFKDLAQEEGVTLVPNILSGLFGDQAVMSDAVHPNALGYAKVANRLLPILNDACHAYAQTVK